MRERGVVIVWYLFLLYTCREMKTDVETGGGTVSRKTGGTANPRGSSLLVSDPAWPQPIPVICISNNVALVSPKEGPKPRQLLSLPPFPATPCLLHVKKTAAYEWLPSARSLTTSLTSPAPSSSSRATSTKDS
ncbi:hypothetical protein MRB53_020563 [Persea americana]|uniref:Uncharacterized protein n=1 Tax=Persea americana TaxID=3435 RepID=A0ACC2L1I4_PERAE|nr:hypothetical protein MRB53_020563 [Persea americana]